MGNAVSPCCHPNSKSSAKLIFWEGTTRIVSGKQLAGEIMFQFPDKMICHANSFFIGRPIPALAIEDELMAGETYFVLPIDRFACNVLSAASLTALRSSSPNKPSPINFGDRPFQYIKGANGRLLIKVLPEFIMRLIATGNDDPGCNSPSNSFLCTTPELQKHFNQLVVSKEQLWSPKLETISECKTRLLSPCRLLRLELKSK